MVIGIIGLGKMGEIITKGLLKSDPTTELWGTTRSEKSAKELSVRLSIPCHTDNRKLAKNSDIIILCTKPHQAEKVLNSIQSEMSSNKLVISICAAIQTEQLFEWSGRQAAIIRAMPNTPCLISQGMTVLCAGQKTPDEHLQIAEKIFSHLGKTAIIDESQMDAATGLSGCGPAYVFLMIEALSEAGVKVGLPRHTAVLLAAQTLSGASQMVLTQNSHPAALKDEVTTPAGCTVDGLMALEEGGLRVTLIKAVLAATRRSEKLRNFK